MDPSTITLTCRLTYGTGYRLLQKQVGHEQPYDPILFFGLSYTHTSLDLLPQIPLYTHFEQWGKAKLHIHRAVFLQFQLPLMASFLSLRLALLALCSFHGVSVNALNIGIQSSETAVQVSKECSRKCESEFCSVPPFLRYGKYCGILYSGCPGETPCDGLDACCMRHDACVQAKGNDYLSQECSQNLINCMEKFKKSGGHTFKGNKCQVDEVIDVINLVMEAALIAGSVFHKP